MTYRILVVHQQPEMQRLIASRLSASCGVKVCLPVDSYVALDLAQTHSYDLLILDGEAPLFSGEEFLETLRDCGICIPVILLVNAPAGLKSSFLAPAPVVATLPKPVNLDRLSETVKFHL